MYGSVKFGLYFLHLCLHHICNVNYIIPLVCESPHGLCMDVYYPCSASAHVIPCISNVEH